MVLHSMKRINYLSKGCFCTKVQPKVYSNTIFLPKTKFPLRLIDRKLVERDEYVHNIAAFDNLYEWQRGHLSEPEFVLHDGPPYANGQPHMGHAINKILKDTILRYEILKGNKVHYIPGWDCHGLPIELKAVSNKESDPIEIRDKARKFAKRTIEEQKRVFQSWGVTGDWKNLYTTYSKDYMKVQLRQFFKLFKKNLIYRDIKPIHWSPSSKTALAEAELEYNEKHVSPSAYIKLKIKDIPRLPSKENDCYAIIWTTTPWTLPANQAICFNEDLSYSLVKKSNSEDKMTYIVATELLKDISKVLKISFQTLQVFPGHTLEGAVYEHPIYKNNMPGFVHSSHVSSSKGTGLVHSAGAHGPDDFIVALKNKLPLVDLVDDNGRFLSKAGVQLEGKNVLTDGNTTVLDMLKENVMNLGKITHSYPYDWRTKEPVIIKASHQWFIDTEVIKNRAIKLLDNVKILPFDRSDIYKSNLIKQIQKRPYWCISRQRKWGVPIPVLYNKTTSETILNENTLNHQLNILDRLGPNFWWQSNEQDLLPPSSFNSSHKIEKSEDIMDIWLDSGLSWAKVLEGTKVADMYLEGVDQFTGWFQSSLLTSVALRDKAPFKTIYVHGFAVDENGQKMSKSVGNVVDPIVISNGGINGKNAYGIDAMRWWVTCHANQDALAYVSKSVLASSTEEVQKIRSILRFALGSISDYDTKTTPENLKLLLIDKYILHSLYQFHQRSQEYMQNYEFHKISALVINFLTNSVSSMYYTVIKDRLYCDPIDCPSRKAVQFCLYQIFETVTQVVAPMIPHLAEELYLYFPVKDNKTYFTSTHPKLGPEWENQALEELFKVLLNCRRDVNRNVGANSNDAIVHFGVSENLCQSIKKIIDLEELENQAADIFQVSRVNIVEDNLVDDYRIKISRSSKKSCPRCRRVNSFKENTLCKRCDELVNYMNKKSAVI